ncbi:MAG: winged helix DNA-binding domain-containing protein [Chloroflexi bacterium]|nr:winged helix DNA-binding domain-containing protein [Chloroflexota bacterium]
MTSDLSRAQVRRLRLQNQRLAEDARIASAASVVRDLCALQSQEWSSAQLAIAARTTGITQEDVRRAREVDRSFVLTWSLRGTLHLVAAEDVAPQLALCGERAIGGTNRRYQQLGLSEIIRENSLDHIAEILAKNGPLIRAELAEKLGARGIPVAGQAIHHLVRYAALRGLICFGPEREGNLTYVLLSEWLPNYKAQEAAEETLPIFARRYLSAYGPASSADFARWTGISAKRAEAAFAAIAGECVACESPVGAVSVLKQQLQHLHASEARPNLRFLPRYDNYLLVYEDRDFMVDAAYAKSVHPGGGLIRACVIIDGQAFANWKLEPKRKTARIVVSPFQALDKSLLPLLKAEVDNLARFLQREIDLRIDEP